jgi:hypothetical protein
VPVGGRTTAAGPTESGWAPLSPVHDATAGVRALDLFYD